MRSQRLYVSRKELHIKCNEMFRKYIGIWNVGEIMWERYNCFFRLNFMALRVAAVFYVGNIILQLIYICI